MPNTEASRIRDRIDTGPRFSETDAVRLNRLFRGTDTTEMLETMLKERMAGDVAIVSSFGAESAVLLHLVSQVDPSVPVLFLETGKHFPETLAYRDQLVERLARCLHDASSRDVRRRCRVDGSSSRPDLLLQLPDLFAKFLIVLLQLPRSLLRALGLLIALAAIVATLELQDTFTCRNR